MLIFEMLVVLGVELPLEHVIDLDQIFRRLTISAVASRTKFLSLLIEDLSCLGRPMRNQISLLIAEPSLRISFPTRECADSSF